MNIYRLSWRNLTSNPLNTFLSILLMSFGVGVISLILLINNQIEGQLQRNIRGVDMVVGAKGSPLQLILSTVYQIDKPTGNISLLEAQKIEKNPLVKSTIPISFGDTYNGFRIVGTTHDYPEMYGVKLNKGVLWEKDFEVVIGCQVAEINDLKIGDEFHGSHGLLEGGEIHNNHSYKIVGILASTNSVIDKLILTKTESVWKMHESNDHAESESNQDNMKDHNHDHEEDTRPKKLHLTNESEITALLVKFRSPVGLMQVPRQINKNTNMQAAVPLFEMNRLISLLGFGVNAINIIALIIIVVSGLSIFISLYNSVKRRRYELALMRVHGASKFQLVKLVIQEGFTLSFLGTFFGLMMSRLSLVIIVIMADNKLSFSRFQFNLISEEIWLVIIALLVGFLAALIPTIQTYKMDITKTLADA